MIRSQLLIIVQDCIALISPSNEHQGLRKAIAGPLCKTAQRCTALPLATSLQIEKTPDLKIPKQYLLLKGLAGQFPVKSEHRRLRYPSLLAAYTLTILLILLKKIAKSNKTVTTQEMTRSQLLIIVQDCTALISPSNEHQGLRKAIAGPLCKTAQRYTALPLATSLQIEKTPDLNIPKQYLLVIGLAGKISNQIRAPKAKIAHPTGSLHINYNYNLTQKKSQIQQDSNNTGNDQVTITYNSTGLYRPNLTFKRAPGDDKSHCWTFVQNCTTVYSPAPSHFTPDRENTRPKHPKAIPITKRTCWPISSQI
jgi:hypothetical protein